MSKQLDTKDDSFEFLDIYILRIQLIQLVTNVVRGCS